MSIYRLDNGGEPTPVSVELWRNDAGDPMGTVVFFQSDQKRVSTSQDLPAEQALELASQEAQKRGGDVAVLDPDTLWTVGWGELVRPA